MKRQTEFEDLALAEPRHWEEAEPPVRPHHHAARKCWDELQKADALLAVSGPEIREKYAAWRERYIKSRVVRLVWRHIALHLIAAGIDDLRVIGDVVALRAEILAALTQDKKKITAKQYMVPARSFFVEVLGAPKLRRGNAKPAARAAAAALTKPAKPAFREAAAALPKRKSKDATAPVKPVAIRKIHIDREMRVRFNYPKNAGADFTDFADVMRAANDGSARLNETQAIRLLSFVGWLALGPKHWPEKTEPSYTVRQRGEFITRFGLAGSAARVELAFLGILAGSGTAIAFTQEFVAWAAKPGNRQSLLEWRDAYNVYRRADAQITYARIYGLNAPR